MRIAIVTELFYQQFKKLEESGLQGHLKSYLKRILSSTCKRLNAVITRIRSVQYTAAICLFVFILLLFPLLFFPFPPGADIGHMLALSYTFEGIYVEGPLRHTPIVPFVMFLFRRVSFGDIGVVLLLTKIFSVALVFPLGVSFYLLSRQLGKNQLAAKFGFFLAVLNPLFLYQILWSGWPQFFGITFAILSIFWLLKTEGGIKHADLACAFFASLTVGSHSYTSMFLCVFLLVYSIIQVIRAGNKLMVLGKMGKIGALCLLFSIPYFFFYWNMMIDLKTMLFPMIFTIFLDSIKGEILLSIPVLGLEIVAPVVIATSFYAKRCRNLTKLIEVVSALAISGGLMFFLTPPVFASRVLYFLMIPAIVLIPVALSKISLPERFFLKVENKRHSRRVMLIEGFTLCLVFLTASTSIANYFLSVDRFTPAGSESLRAFEAIQKDSEIDKVLVISYWPEFDGWWLEGVTKRVAFMGSSGRWFILQSEMDRMILGRTLLLGTHVIDGCGYKILDNSPYLANYTHILMAVSGAEAVGIITIPDSLSNVVVRPIANPFDCNGTVYNLLPGETKKGINNILIVRHVEKWGILKKELSLNSNQDLAAIKYSFESYNCSISNVTIGIAAFDEIQFEDLRQNGNVFYFTYRHRWEGIAGSFQIEAKSNASIKGQYDGNSHLFLTLTPLSLIATKLDVSLEVKVKGIDVDTPSMYSLYEKCEEEQIRYVYIREDTWMREKFEKDPHFIVFYKEGDVIVYKYIGEPRNINEH